MENFEEKKPDENLRNTQTTCVSVPITEKELDELDKYCQQTGKTHQQAFLDGINYLNAKK